MILIFLRHQIIRLAMFSLIAGVILIRIGIQGKVNNYEHTGPAGESADPEW